jgi:hypothetical protein
VIAPIRGAEPDVQLSESTDSMGNLSDFEEWRFWQSNVMVHQSLEHQKKRYAGDKEWHGRSETRPYKSKA